MDVIHRGRGLKAQEWLSLPGKEKKGEQNVEKS